MFRLSILALVAASLACQEEQPDPTPATTSTGAPVTTGSGASTNTGMTSDDTGIGATCRDFKPGECGECIEEFCCAEADTCVEDETCKTCFETGNYVPCSSAASPGGKMFICLTYKCAAACQGAFP